MLTLAGLGVPVGAWFRDETTGKTTLYGVSATTEEEIEEAVGRITEKLEEEYERYASFRRSAIFGTVITLLAVAVAGLVYYRHRQNR